MRINRAARPTAYTAADHMRMRAADERHAAMLRRQARKVWIYRVVYVVGVLAVAYAVLRGAEPDTYAALQVIDGEARAIDHGLTLGDCMRRIETLSRASCELE